MAQKMQSRRNRTATPERWQKAAQRAVAEGIQVRQLAGSGQWIANSGSDPAVAYEVDVTGNIAHGCSCLAGLNDDPVCRHRAAFTLLIGALSPETDFPRLRSTSSVSAAGALAARLAPAAALVAGWRSARSPSR